MELMVEARVGGAGRRYGRLLLACWGKWPWVKTLVLQKREGRQLSPGTADSGLHGGSLLLGEEGEDGGL